MATIREAICEALETKKTKHETEQDFIKRISSDAFTDEQWDALALADNGTEAQEFANAVTAALKDETDLPSFPDEMHGEESEDEEPEQEILASEAASDNEPDNEEEESIMDKRKTTKKERTTIKDRTQKIADMASTMAMKEIAEELGIGYQTVQQTLAKLGIKAAKKAKERKVSAKATKVKKATVRATKPKKANGKTNGVRGEKIKEIVRLLKRSGGCTAKDVLEATGWPSVSMPAMAKQAGLTLNKKKVQGEVTRYSAK